MSTPTPIGKASVLPFTTSAMEALADLALCAADYESHWRFGIEQGRQDNEALAECSKRIRAARERLASEKFINGTPIPVEFVHCIEAAFVLATARVEHIRPAQYREDASFASIHRAAAFMRENMAEGVH